MGRNTAWHAQDQTPITRAFQAATTFAQSYVAHLLGELSSVFLPLSHRYAKATGQYRRAHLETADKMRVPLVTCTSDPNAIKFSMEEAADNLRRHGDDMHGPNALPLRGFELLRLAEHFRSHPAARVADLLLELGYCEVGSVDIQQGAAPPFTRASDVFHQVIETLPVLGVDIGSGRTRRKPENCMIIISLVHKEAAHVLSALMASSAERFQVSGTRN